MFTHSMSSGIILTRKTDLSIGKLTVKMQKEKKTLFPNATSYKKIGNCLADQFHGKNTRNNPTGKKRTSFVISRAFVEDEASDPNSLAKILNNMAV